MNPHSKQLTKTTKHFSRYQSNVSRLVFVYFFLVKAGSVSRSGRGLNASIMQLLPVRYGDKFFCNWGTVSRVTERWIVVSSQVFCICILSVTARHVCCSLLCVLLRTTIFVNLTVSRISKSREKLFGFSTRLGSSKV
jgi:hypothetical protein